MRRDEDHTLRKVYKTVIPGEMERGTKEKEDGTTEHKMETCNPTILGKVGLLD